MLTIHLIGHVYITDQDRVVPVSAKAVALIAFLSLERLPQHRERLADLLWDTAESRKNLRVELARIRSAGLDIFPSSHQLLHLDHVGSDYDFLLSRLTPDLNQAELGGLLQRLRGLPFTGLEDIGSLSFREWIDQQRWLMLGQLEQHLRMLYRAYAGGGRTWATRLILERAELLGLSILEEEPPAAPAPAPVAAPAPAAPARTAGLVNHLGVIDFARVTEELTLRQFFAGAPEGTRPAQARVACLYGPTGSGKSYLLGKVARQFCWPSLTVSCSSPLRLILANIVQFLIRLSPPQDAERLGDLLLRPGTPEEDIVRVSYFLARLDLPVLFVFKRAQAMSPELLNLTEFLIGSCRDREVNFVFLATGTATASPHLRALLGGVPRGDRLELCLPALSQRDLHRILEQHFPLESAQRIQTIASHLIQRTEGNPMHLLSLLIEMTRLDAPPGIELPPRVRSSYGTETAHWPAPLRSALARLSVIYGRFDLGLACAVLGQGEADCARLLQESVERQVLVEGEQNVPLRWQPGGPGLPGTAHAAFDGTYLFQSEGLRIALAAQLTHSARQEVRRRLADACADTATGLAAVYAHRAGLVSEAAHLRSVYKAGLPRDNPMHEYHPLWQNNLPPLYRYSPGTAVCEVEPPPPAVLGAPVSYQGYHLSHETGGLSLTSSAHYGPPSTLRLHFGLPDLGRRAGAAQELRLVWRLDLYRGGEELGPQVSPYPLRVRYVGAPVAYVLCPLDASPYEEEAVCHLPCPDIQLGAWMEHRLRLTAPQAAGLTLELSSRAVDLALSVAALEWEGVNLLT